MLCAAVGQADRRRRSREEGSWSGDRDELGVEVWSTGSRPGGIASREREEVDQVTEMVAHPSRKGVTEALVGELQAGDVLSGMAGGGAADLYEPPVAVLDHIEHESESYWWIVVVLFSAALAWAAYCRSTGGNPVIRATWRGYIIRCY